MTVSNFNHDVQDGNWLAAYRAKAAASATPAIPAHPPTDKNVTIAENTCAKTAPGIFGNSGNFGRDLIGPAGGVAAAPGSSGISRQGCEDIPLPNAHNVLAFIAGIPDQPTLWRVVDAWARPRRIFSREANKALSDALKVRWDTMLGQQHHGPG